jgi:hypothetical protein
MIPIPRQYPMALPNPSGISILEKRFSIEKTHAPLRLRLANILNNLLTLNQ